MVENDTIESQTDDSTEEDRDLVELKSMMLPRKMMN